ncbi:MAG: class I SAM-dependent methyltransferase [Paracoccaceae bacterium]
MNLHSLLVQRIRHQGPISIAEYMADCLLHPDFGYYSTRDPLGTAGDFTTAPEISQMFGELIGLSLAQSWLDQGRPASFTLAELGPGRGTLMADILRATLAVPGFIEAADIHLVEVSDVLQATQAETLSGHEPVWHDTISSLPDQPLFLVANEFFDALPIRQFLRSGDGWCERRIGLTEDRLCFGRGAMSVQPVLMHRLQDTRDGDLVEICDASGPIVTEIANRIAANGGACLIIDYGDWRSLGDTFQALRDHEPVDPLDSPGQADLTAHVDFETLATLARACGISHSRLTTQGVFLERLGITDRARALASRLDAQQVETLITAHRRLTHPEEMGNLFKVLGLFPAQDNPPPGLDA